jgi:shikimate dehydrogenase
MFVADVIMEPHMTALLAAAKEEGAQIVHGRGMMDHQLDRMADFFSRALAQPCPAQGAAS